MGAAVASAGYGVTASDRSVQATGSSARLIVDATKLLRLRGASLPTCTGHSGTPPDCFPSVSSGGHHGVSFRRYSPIPRGKPGCRWPDSRLLSPWFRGFPRLGP